MILKQKNGVSFFQFPNLIEFPDIRHGIFTRSGGYSQGAYKSLNVSFGVGDEDRAVKQNRGLISKCMDEKALFFVKQVHGTEVVVLSSEEEHLSHHFLAPSNITGDAVITNIPDRVLVIPVADCQAVLIYDPVRHVVANIHSGWRGSVNNIIGKTIRKMEKHFYCKPKDMFAGIGPSLGPCCAEFINYKKEIPETFWKYRNHSDHFDFWAVSKDQLADTGVSRENIYSSGQCTRCNTDLFFSYRGEVTTGRFAVGVVMRET
ncbi:peptidoglycan editing factor PgeF [Desulfococcaceae bacterium HSG8]|nr:peptidoglycan editing factor PgeF [Desulfococcaceae bacterium HSG8]